jgi:hypothetical protein
MNQKTEPSGLGGWLILPMLGLMFLPFKLGAMLAVNYYPIFSEGYWEVLTTPGSEAYHALWAPLLIFEIAVNSIFFISAIVLLVFFFQKHHRFPKLIIWFLGLNLAFVGIDFFAADLIPAVASEPDPESTKELIRTIVGAAIWIPYFLKSVRVKNTFTNGMIEQGSGGNA